MSASTEKRALGIGQLPNVRARYTHMMLADQATWTRFLEKNIVTLDEVWYDVHVGTPMEIPEDSPEYLVAVAQGVSRKRIDVVARQGKKYFLIEVKPHLNMESVGQALTYRDLFIKEFEVNGSVTSVIVADTADVDVVGLAVKNGIICYLITGIVP